MKTVHVRSCIAAPLDLVWSHVSGFEGVNDELAPVLRMSHPPGQDRLHEGLPLGRPLFRSWLLLFGVLPVDYDLIGFAAIETGRGFAERSTMGSMKIWHHDRRLRPVTGGVEITDRLAFSPRVAGTGALAQAIVAVLFRHRHRRLARRFGGMTTIEVLRG